MEPKIHKCSMCCFDLTKYPGQRRIIYCHDGHICKENEFCIRRKLNDLFHLDPQGMYICPMCFRTLHALTQKELTLYKKIMELKVSWWKLAQSLRTAQSGFTIKPVEIEKLFSKHIVDVFKAKTVNIETMEKMNPRSEKQQFRTPIVGLKLRPTHKIRTEAPVFKTVPLLPKPKSVNPPTEVNGFQMFQPDSVSGNNNDCCSNKNSVVTKKEGDHCQVSSNIPLNEKGSCPQTVLASSEFPSTACGIYDKEVEDPPGAISTNMVINSNVNIKMQYDSKHSPVPMNRLPSSVDLSRVKIERDQEMNEVAVIKTKPFPSSVKIKEDPEISSALPVKIYSCSGSGKGLDDQMKLLPPQRSIKTEEASEMSLDLPMNLFTSNVKTMKDQIPVVPITLFPNIAHSNLNSLDNSNAIRLNPHEPTNFETQQVQEVCCYSAACEHRFGSKLSNFVKNSASVCSVNKTDNVSGLVRVNFRVKSQTSNDESTSTSDGCVLSVSSPKRAKLHKQGPQKHMNPAVKQDSVTHTDSSYL